jgi:hypothetical protein
VEVHYKAECDMIKDLAGAGEDTALRREARMQEEEQARKLPRTKAGVVFYGP